MHGTIEETEKQKEERRMLEALGRIRHGASIANASAALNVPYWPLRNLCLEQDWYVVKPRGGSTHGNKRRMKRQREVIADVLEGMTIKDAATKWGITDRTVYTYLHNHKVTKTAHYKAQGTSSIDPALAFRKLDENSRCLAIDACVRKGEAPVDICQKYRIRRSTFEKYMRVDAPCAKKSLWSWFISWLR